MRAPPGPKGLPIIGNIEAYEEDRLGFLTMCAREFGDVAAYSENIYVVSCPELIERTLVNTNREFIIAQNLFRQDIAEAYKDDASYMRGLMTCGMTRTAIANQVPGVVRLTSQMIQGWGQRRELDVQHEMEALTAQTSAEFCFGEDSGRVPLLSRELLDALVPIASSPFTFPSWFPRRSMSRARAAFRVLKQEIQVVVGRRRGQHSPTCDLASNLMLPGPQGRTLSDEQIAGALLPILVASLRVPAAALSWTLYLLSQHQDVNEKVRKEVRLVTDGRPLAADDVGRLPYTKSVVKEALRLYPPTWLFDRRVTSACELGGYPLRPGHRLVFSPFVVQRDPRYFHDPQEFVADRWNNSGWEADLPRYAYFPFGGGPRACVGTAFAMAEILAIVATVTQRLRLCLAPTARVTIESRNTLVPAGLRMIAEREDSTNRSVGVPEGCVVSG